MSTPAPPSLLVDRLFDGLPRDQAATLRRQARTMGVLDPAAAGIVYPVVGNSVPEQDAGMLLACLWAVWNRRYTAPINADGIGLGDGLRRMDPDLAARHVGRLAASATETFPTRMQQVVDVLSTMQIPLDWRLLHRDMRSWMWGDRQRVLRRWARQLYSPRPSTATTAPSTEKD